MTDNEKLNYRLNYLHRAHCIQSAITELKLQPQELDDVAAMVRQASIKELEKIRDILLSNASPLIKDWILEL